MEFSENGFEQASTNRIVQNAGIGKGTLFYYFPSKKELFFFLIDYAISFIQREYLDRIDDQEGDFLEKYKKAAQVKLEIYNYNPQVLNLLGNLVVNQEVELPPDLEKRLIETQQQGYFRLFNNIDKSLIRKDLDPDRAIKLIQWMMDGYTGEMINNLKGKKLSQIDLEPYWEDFYAYLDMLRRVFYQQKEGEN